MSNNNFKKQLFVSSDIGDFQPLFIPGEVRRGWRMERVLDNVSWIKMMMKRLYRQCRREEQMIEEDEEDGRSMIEGEILVCVKKGRVVSVDDDEEEEGARDPSIAK